MKSRVYDSAKGVKGLKEALKGGFHGIGNVEFVEFVLDCVGDSLVFKIFEVIASCYYLLIFCLCDFV